MWSWNAQTKHQNPAKTQTQRLFHHNPNKIKYNIIINWERKRELVLNCKQRKGGMLSEENQINAMQCKVALVVVVWKKRDALVLCFGYIKIGKEERDGKKKGGCALSINYSLFSFLIPIRYVLLTLTGLCHNLYIPMQI